MRNLFSKFLLFSLPQVFGEELVSCLFSKNRHAREVGLRRVGQMASGALLLGVGVGRAGVQISPSRQASTQSMLECCASVLAVMCADPVYKVFVSALVSPLIG